MQLLGRIESNKRKFALGHLLTLILLISPEADAQMLKTLGFSETDAIDLTSWGGIALRGHLILRIIESQIAVLEGSEIGAAKRCSVRGLELEFGLIYE